MLFHGDLNVDFQVSTQKPRPLLTGLMMLSLVNTPLIPVMEVPAKYPKILSVQEIIGLQMTYQMMIQLEIVEILSSS